MGQKQYGYGMSYESGLVMLKAWMYKYTPVGDTAKNGCMVDFAERKPNWVIKIMFNGGVSKDGYHPLIPSDTEVFTIMKKRGQTILPASGKFLGLADLGTDTEVWKTYPQIYETDGDNYIDLCLKLDEGEEKDITAVALAVGRVFPPRGSGPNVAHMVAVEIQDDMARDEEDPTMDKDATDEDPIKGNEKRIYPYNLEMTPVADKLFDIYLKEVLEIVGVTVPTSIGLIAVPLIGAGLGVGVMFLSSWVPGV